MATNLEYEHDDVYGQSFALYSKAELEEFLDPLTKRYAANGIDPRKVFQGKVCLDAGCGNGRGALFMLRNDAVSVDCVDISHTNIESTSENLRQFGFDNFTCHNQSLEDLPYEDETFDFVWCNGVIMHTAQPDACLREIARVLKVGGQSWVYVYGTGGVYWYCVRRFREIFEQVESQAIIDTLGLMRYPVRFIGEYIDDWKAPYLRTYTADDFGSRLKELGFDNTDPLPYGVAYDTSHRRTLYPEDADWLGEGDLRYFLTKLRKAGANQHIISESEHGSTAAFSQTVADRFAPHFDALVDAVKDNPISAIASCAKIQRAMYDIFNSEGRLDVEEYEAVVRDTIRLTRGISQSLCRNASAPVKATSKSDPVRTRKSLKETEIDEAAWKSLAAFNRAIRDKKVVFFGVSDYWTEKTVKLSNPNVDFLVDNSSTMIGDSFKGLAIRSPEVLREKLQDTFVVITSGSYYDIYPQLIEYGLQPGADFCITPALNNSRIISDIHTHDATILISSPEHKAYANLDQDDDVGGGLYELTLRNQHYRKVVDGTFNQIVDAGDAYYVTDEMRGVCKISKDYRIVDIFGAESGDKCMGIAYCPERNIVFLGHTRYDTVSAHDASTNEKLFEIELSEKHRRLGRAQHWINDLHVAGDFLYISMFSHSGAYLQGVFDGGILQVDLENTDNRYVLVRNAWMPHTVRFFDPQICYLDSMNGLFYRSIHNVIGEFPGFIRGLGYDGHYYFVGQSENRDLQALKGIKRHISLSAGLYLFDDDTKAAKFISTPCIRQIHDLCVVQSSKRSPMKNAA